MSELTERAKRVLANYPSHVAAREQAKILLALVKEVEQAERKQEASLSVAQQYGGIDGAHHKAWVIDQMCRVLAAESYEKFVAENTKES